MNAFINFIKRSLIREKIRNKIKVLKKVKVLSLPILDFFAKLLSSISLSYFFVELGKKLIEELY